MLKLNSKPLFAAKSIVKPNWFLRKHGFTAVTASRIVTGGVKELHLDRLEKLCLLLNCTPHDLLEWTPDENLSEPKRFELSKLIKEKKIVVLSEELRGLNLAEVEEVYRFVENKKREKAESLKQ
ncbi:MAG: helix-turn-helix transcriptional regulator [Ignavibacteriaceae bacterium]